MRARVPLYGAHMRTSFRTGVVVMMLVGCSGKPPSAQDSRDASMETDATDAPNRDARPDAPRANCVAKTGTAIATRVVASGFFAPVLVTAPTGDARLFVVEQAGTVVVVKDRQKRSPAFLDLSEKVRFGGEQGLLGLAFHPQFATNRKFYVNYTRRSDGATVIAEFQARGDQVDNTTPERTILVVAQPYDNHNAGAIEFGPDGYLYVPLGDGGDGGDPGNRAQNPRDLLGKVLRLDVNATSPGKPYRIPADNPYAASADGPNDPRPEIWQLGLRNPFRFAFDEANGDLYIADVGQDLWEELNAGPNTAGRNYGWRQREGRHCFNPGAGCQTEGMSDPVVEHHHNTGWKSIIAGVVYRGACYPDLVGTFVYTDYYISELWGFQLVAGTARNDHRLLARDDLGGITSIHTDGFGEMFATRATPNAGELLELYIP